MAEAKHTPGPWKVESLDGIERGADVVSANEVRDICNCYPNDAHLIAAAPELLEALQEIVSDDQFCGDDWGSRRDAWIATARAAIAKATGGAQ